MAPVRNRRNKIVVDAARLHRSRARRERGQTLIEGPHLLEEAVRAGASIDTVFAFEEDTDSRKMAEAHGLRLTVVDAGALSLLAGTETPRGPLAVVSISESDLRPERDLLVGWGLTDPGNVGTLIRTAAAFGWGYGYGPGSADPWSPKALRSGTGGQFQTTITRIRNLEALDDWHLVAAVVEGGSPVRRPTTGRVAVLIGEEATGLPVEVVERAELHVTIPTPGPTESLNAASAGAILVYEMSKPARHAIGEV